MGVLAPSPASPPRTPPATPRTPQHAQEWQRRWPPRKFPLLVDGARNVVETSIVIEYLHLAHPGPARLLPGDAAKRADALAVATEKLELAWAWLEGCLAGRTWAAGDSFSLADCAAAPALFYADWTHPTAIDARRLQGQSCNVRFRWIAHAVDQRAAGAA